MSEKAESQEREADVSEEIRRCSATKLSGFAAGRSQKAYLWTSPKKKGGFRPLFAGNHFGLKNHATIFTPISNANRWSFSPS